MEFLRRTKTHGYIYDLRFFWGAFLITCLIVFYVCYKFNFDFSKKLHLNCESPICENPIIENPELYKYCHVEWCSQKQLPRGEYGTPYPDDWLFNNTGKISFFLFVVAFCLNHLIHNKNNKFEILLGDVPQWLKKYEPHILKFFDELEDDEEDD